MNDARAERSRLLSFLLSCLCLLGPALTWAATGAVAKSGYPAIDSDRFSIRFESAASVDAMVDITATLTTPDDLPVGSSICVAGHWQHTAALQNDWLSKPGYVSLSTTPDGVSLAKRSEPMTGVYGGLDSILQVPCFDVTTGIIPGNSSLNFGIKQLRMPETATDSFNLAAFVRPADDGSAYYMTSNRLTVDAGEAEQLALTASSMAMPGEEISLWVRLEDEFGNLARSRAYTLDLLVNNVYQKRVTLEAATQKIAGISFNSPGVYQLEVRTGGGGLRARANPVVVSSASEEVMWLNLGATTAISDGISSETMQQREALGRYDLLVTSDHEEAIDAGKPSPELPAGIWRSAAGEQTGSLLELRQPDHPGIQIALAEKPSDYRDLVAENLRLVQVASPNSDYRWMGDEAAKRGYRVGFVAIDHSHQYPRAGRKAYTGVRIKPSQSWFDALAAGQTFVAVGEKILLHGLTEELRFGQDLTLQVDVTASTPIAMIALFKNGELLKSMSASQAEVEGQRYLLSVNAPNAPFSGLETRPRNGREWIGYLATRDTALNADSSTDFLVRRSRDAQRLDFLTHSHGQKRTLRLTLSEPTPDTVLEIGLAAVYEDAAWLPADRLPQEIPAQRFLVPLSELQQGAIRQFSVGGYIDRITLAAESDLDITEASFTYTDTAPARIGDYYYFRVEMINGSFAYSSPVFVDAD